MPHAVGGVSATTSTTSSAWDILGRAIQSYSDIRTARMERDILRLDADMARTRNTVPVVETNVDARLVGETLRSTFTDPINLVMLGVAGLLGYILIKG